MRINNFKSIDILSQKIILLEKNIQSINSNIDVLIQSKKFKENENKISEIKISYAEYKNDLDNLFFRKGKITSILSNATQDKGNLIDKRILEILYSETFSIVGSLSKEFSELLKFNEELLQNKIHYFTEQLEKIEKRIVFLEKEKNQLFEKHKNIIMLIEENKIDEYTHLNNRLSEYTEELGKNKNIIHIYTNLQETLDKSQNELKSINVNKSSEYNSLEFFNEYFSKFSEQTNGEPFMLYKTPKGFPFGIEYVKRN